jgi:hypothetical protein
MMGTANVTLAFTAISEVVRVLGFMLFFFYGIQVIEAHEHLDLRWGTQRSSHC